MDENKWYIKEMRRLEIEQKKLHDNYNSEIQKSNQNDIEHLLNSTLKYSPDRRHTWETYVQELVTHIKYADDKNTKAHIEGKTPWYTHRSPLGCFMCEDIALRHVMLQILQLMAKQYPNNKF